MNNIPIDWKKLKNICLAKEKALIPEGNYYFKDNGSKILAVAHCDYVCTGKPDYVAYKYKGDLYVQSETLDDRLGVYIITELLPSLGIVTDILLTTDEERGASTASAFETTKKYNWIFSFDRRGTDIVAYDYEDDALRAQVMEGTGVRLGYGTFSDIVYLEHLGVKGLNFGTGYTGEHTPACNASQRAITIGVAQFMKWYKLYKNIQLPHTPTPYSKTKSWKDNYYYESAWEDGYDYNSRFNYVYKGGKPIKVEDEDIIDEQDGELYAKGYCDYCDEWGDINYSQVWGGWLCFECLEKLVSGKGDKVEPTGRCQLCGISEDSAFTRGDSIEEVTLINKKTVYVCSTCADYLYIHSKEKDFINAVRFKY